MTPTFLLIVLLVNFFPYTGLGRILVIPTVVILNSIIIIISLALPYKAYTIPKIVVAIFITIFITVGLYPQEFNPSVMVQVKEAIRTVSEIDKTTRDELNANGNVHDPRYVVALYKFKDEISIDGTYQLYEHENVYFYDYTINNIDEIGSKLIGYHKAVWWYLNTFNK